MLDLNHPDWIDLRQGCERSVALGTPFAIDPKVVLVPLRALDQSQKTAEEFFEEHRYCQWGEVD
jgi:hypothetical protein